jgi:hypothetical protein
VTKIGPSNLRQSGQNLRSSGSNGARPRRTNQTVSHGLSGSRSVSVICAQNQPCSTPLNPTSGNPGLRHMEDNRFTVQGYLVLIWNNRLLLVKRCRCAHSHCSSSMATRSRVQLIRSIPLYLPRPYLLHGPTSPHNTRVPLLPSRAALLPAMVTYRRRVLMTTRGSVRDNPGHRHLFLTHDRHRHMRCPRRISHLNLKPSNV